MCASSRVVCVPHPGTDATTSAIDGAAWEASYIFAVFEHARVFGLVDGCLEEVHLAPVRKSVAPFVGVAVYAWIASVVAAGGE